MEASREGAPTGEREIAVIKTSFAEQDVNAKVIDVCSKEEWKMIWMRETRIRFFMQMELEACRNELDWVLRCHDCIVNTRPEEHYHLFLYPFLPIMPRI